MARKLTLIMVLVAVVFSSAFGAVAVKKPKFDYTDYQYHEKQAYPITTRHLFHARSGAKGNQSWTDIKYDLFKVNYTYFDTGENLDSDPGQNDFYKYDAYYNTLIKSCNLGVKADPWATTYASNPRGGVQAILNHSTYHSWQDHEGYKAGQLFEEIVLNGNSTNVSTKCGHPYKYWIRVNGTEVTYTYRDFEWSTPSPEVIEVFHDPTYDTYTITPPSTPVEKTPQATVTATTVIPASESDSDPTGYVTSNYFSWTVNPMQTPEHECYYIMEPDGTKKYMQHRCDLCKRIDEINTAIAGANTADFLISANHTYNPPRQASAIHVANWQTFRDWISGSYLDCWRTSNWTSTEPNPQWLTLAESPDRITWTDAIASPMWNAWLNAAKRNIEEEGIFKGLGTEDGYPNDETHNGIFRDDTAADYFMKPFKGLIDTDPPLKAWKVICRSKSDGAVYSPSWLGLEWWKYKTPGDPEGNTVDETSFDYVHEHVFYYYPLDEDYITYDEDGHEISRLTPEQQHDIIQAECNRRIAYNANVDVQIANLVTLMGTCKLPAGKDTWFEKGYSPTVSMYGAYGTFSKQNPNKIPSPTPSGFYPNAKPTRWDFAYQEAYTQAVQPRKEGKEGETTDYFIKANVSCNVHTFVHEAQAYKTYFSVYETTPLVLDLDRNGRIPVAGNDWKANTSRFDSANARFFDFDGNGNRAYTEWFNGEGKDGLLIMPDERGQVRNGLQLFGNAGGYEDGFQKLSEICDTDRNGRIEGGELKGLALWVDENRNAVCEPQEIKTLEDYGITAIETGHSEYAGYYQTADGQKHRMWDWFPSVINTEFHPRYR